MNVNSCVRCFKRKVKCDKQRPCSACIRHKAECEYRAPNPTRQRKERPRQDALLKRLRQYESLLRYSGIDPTSLPPELQLNNDDRPDFMDKSGVAEPSQLHTSESATESAGQYSKSQLVFKDGRSKYLDNNLWTRVIEEVPDAGDSFGYSSDEGNDETETAEDNADLIFGLTPASDGISELHPPIEHVSELWQIFVENVNSLIKLVHEPTLELAINDSMANLSKVSKKLEALLFSIYSVAIMSLTNLDCKERFGEPRQVLLRRYRLATKVALSRAKFLKTGDIVIVQAYLLYLISMRDFYDAHTIWTLMGVAGRLAEGMGLHRDGSELGLPPFETEIRRRVWWQLKMFDFRITELAGRSNFKNSSQDPQLTRLPSNVNDDQLYPGMLTFPVEPEGVTDMCFCSLLSEFGHYWTTHAAKMRAAHGKDSSLWDNYTSRDEIAEKDRTIDQLEKILEDKYVRYCDPTQPVQLMTFLVARSAINNMHFIAHHPRRWNSDKDIPNSERQYIWNLAIKLLEGEVTVRSSRQLDRFTWQTTSHFPWAQTIYILDCLRANPLLPEAVKAWRLIGEVFDYRPQLILNKKPMSIALGNLCLKAFNAREAAATQQGKIIGKPPNYIAQLRSQRQAAKDRRQSQEGKHRQPNLPQQAVVPEHVLSSESSLPQPDAGLASTMDEIGLTDIKNTSVGSTEQSAYESHLNSGSAQTSSKNPVSWSFATSNECNPTLSTSTSDPMTLDVDLLLEHGSYMDDSNIMTMDWNQWDALLGDWNASFTGSGEFL